MSDIEKIVKEINNTDQEVVNGHKLPSLNSLIEFQNDINIALQKFGEVNGDTEVGVIMPMIFQIFLTFPYTWFKDAGQEDKFVQCIKDEVDHFVKKVVRQS